MANATANAQQAQSRVVWPLQCNGRCTTEQPLRWGHALRVVVTRSGMEQVTLRKVSFGPGRKYQTFLAATSSTRTIAACAPALPLRAMTCFCMCEPVL